jgi:hypothetical protein
MAPSSFTDVFFVESDAPMSMSAARLDFISSFVFRFFAELDCISSLPRFELSLVPSALEFMAGPKSGSKARCIRKTGLGKVMSFPSDELYKKKRQKRRKQGEFYV